MSEAGDYPGGTDRLPTAVMSGHGENDGHQATNDQCQRKESLGTPSLGDDTAGYLRANVAPEEGAEDQMLHRIVPSEYLRREKKERDKSIFLACITL